MIEVKFWIVGIVVVVLSGILAWIGKLLINMLLKKLQEISDKLEAIVNNITKILTEYEHLKEKVEKLEEAVAKLKERQDRCGQCVSENEERTNY